MMDQNILVFFFFVSKASVQRKQIGIILIRNILLKNREFATVPFIERVGQVPWFRYIGL
jgi:hypothetical protein